MSTPNTGKEEKQQDHLDTVGGYILQSLKKKKTNKSEQESSFLGSYPK